MVTADIRAESSTSCPAICATARQLTRHGRQGQFSAWQWGDNGPLIVALHGFPDHALTYRYQIDAWLAAGYRVLLPVMRGYEPGSVQPKGEYFVNQLAQDLIDWLDELDVASVQLVGPDWGAVTGWVAIAMAPQRFLTFTSLAIPPLKRFAASLLKHPRQLRYSWYMGFFQLRGLADFWVERNDWQFIRTLWAVWSPGWQAPDALLQPVLDAFAQPGVKQAALGYYRCLFQPLTVNGRASLAWVNKNVTVPTLVITGAQDGCMMTRFFEAALNQADFDAEVRLQRIDDTGHFMHLEKPQLVVESTLRHFAG
jgi:pimeloyl-ACP methyl ester carboxylesterase